MNEAGATRIERLLASLRGRALLILGLAALVSLVTTVPHVETADLRGRDVDLLEIYIEQFVIWATWGVLSLPLIAAAGWLLRSTGSWLAFVLVMTPASLVVSYGFLQLDYYVHKPTEAEVREWHQEQQRLREERRAEREEFGRPNGRPGPGSGLEGRSRSGGRGPDRIQGEGGPRDEPQREFDRRRNRWRAMRAGMEAPNLSYVHWRFRWIQNALIFWALLGMSGGLAAFLGLRRKERVAAELELRTSELHGELASAQLEALKGQLQPHFLFNALHSVGGLIRAGEEQQALRTLAAIGQLLRSTLELGDEAEVSLEAELRIARRYVEIEQIRFGDRLKIEIEAPADLGDALIPTLLLLPLVENAVKYGVAPKLEGGHIRILARRAGGSLEVIVRDDGAGFPEQVLNGESSSAERRSIGMENTRGRLSALYGASHEFALSNCAEGGAEVRILLPYHTEPVTELATND